MKDWTAEFDNRKAVPQSEMMISEWGKRAAQFRSSSDAFCENYLDLRYGKRARNLLDLFVPMGTPKGTVIFIHGGYWRMLDKSYSSHLATGPLAHGWAVAIPSYTLTPEVRIKDISREIAAAIEHVAGKTDGPLRLIGHSAGGHLVARMLCADNLLSTETFARIEHTVAVSGLFDLENLQYAAMNADLQLDLQEVKDESPGLLGPRKTARITCFVGADEKPEFLRQNGLLSAWQEKGAEVNAVTDTGKNHFTVIEPLSDPNSLLISTLLATYTNGH